MVIDSTALEISWRVIESGIRIIYAYIKAVFILLFAKLSVPNQYNEIDFIIRFLRANI